MREIEDLIKKAEKYIKTAETAFNDEDYDSCVSRAYYAMFYLAEAVLLTKDLKPSSHVGVITLFGEHFIKSGIFERELGKFLRRAYDSRQKGDYSIGFLVTKEEAEKRLKEAKIFIEKLKNYLKDREK